MSAFEKMIKENEHLQEYLFVRGFLLTDRDFDDKAYPFMGHWSKKPIGGG